MPKPVCVKCKKFYRMKRSGLQWTEGMPLMSQNPGSSPSTDKFEVAGWTGYKVWMSDLWECQGCGGQILCGHGASPVVERHHAGFEAESDKSVFRVDDC